jgi:uncharacterized RDD family membrane protein YckC
METYAAHQLDLHPMTDILGIIGLSPKKNPPDKKYAGFNRRMLAATIDSLIAAVTIGPLMDRVFRTKDMDMMAVQEKIQNAANDHEAVRIFMHALHESGAVSNFVVQTLALTLATGICWHFWAATPGKMLLRMKVVDATTEAPINDAQIVLRLFGYIVSTLGLCVGFFWISFDKRRQGWHDKIADTVVISTKKSD